MLFRYWQWADVVKKKTGTTLGLFTYSTNPRSDNAWMAGFRRSSLSPSPSLYCFWAWAGPAKAPFPVSTARPLLLPFVTLSVLLEGDVKTVILMRGMHAVLLFASGPILDQTFG